MRQAFITFLIASTITLMAGCKSTGVWEYQHEDGRVKSEKWKHNNRWNLNPGIPYAKQQTDNGVLKTWWDVGKKYNYNEFSFSNGKYHGVSKLWFRNQQLHSIGTNVNNQGVGIWTYYYESGAKQQEKHHNDCFTTNFVWFESGQLKSTWGYRYRSRHGRCMRFDADGNVLEDEYYQRGKLAQAPKGD